MTDLSVKLNQGSRLQNIDRLMPDRLDLWGGPILCQHEITTSSLSYCEFYIKNWETNILGGLQWCYEIIYHQQATRYTTIQLLFVVTDLFRAAENMSLRSGDAHLQHAGLLLKNTQSQ